MKRKTRVSILLLALFIGLWLASGAFAATRDLLVIRGQYDRIEGVLSDLGFGDRMDVVADDSSVLSMNFSQYSAIFINCDYDNPTDKPDAAFLEKIKAFVHGGGMIYVTDDAANFLKNWEGEMQYTINYDSEVWGSGNWRTTVVDPALRAKFPSDRFDSNGDVVIHHSYDNGEQIVNAGRATVLLKNGSDPGIDPDGFPVVAGQVQAIDFRPSAGGRVVYTTFHNHPLDNVPTPGTDDYTAYQNVLTVMKYICGSLGTATEQEVLLGILGASVSDLVGNPQGGNFSELVSGWKFDIPAGASQLTFALYAATTRSATRGAANDPVFTLTAPDGTTHQAQANPTTGPVVFHVPAQQGLWNVQCTDNTGAVPSTQMTTGMALSGTFGTASPAPGGSVTQVATPTANPAGGTYSSARSVTLSCSTSGAKIYYTLNGSTPTANATPYTSPIAISSSTTLKAIAIASGMTDSSVMTQVYTISPGGGTKSSSSGCDAGAMGLLAVLLGCALRLRSGHDGCNRRK